MINVACCPVGRTLVELGCCAMQAPQSTDCARVSGLRVRVLQADCVCVTFVSNTPRRRDRQAARHPASRRRRAGRRQDARRREGPQHCRGVDQRTQGTAHAAPALVALCVRVCVCACACVYVCVYVCVCIAGTRAVFYFKVCRASI